MSSKQFKIAFFDAKSYDKRFFDAENKKYNYAITYFETRLTLDSAPLAKGFDGVCAFVNDDLSEDVIEILLAGGVKILAMRCAGYNNVNLFATQGRMPVVRVPAYSPHAVAEHAAALLLTLNRKTHRAYYRVRENNFSINGLLGFDLCGKTAGVIGTGKIGKILTQILRGFGMRILAYDYYPDQQFAADNNVEYCDLPALYKNSDVISLHCPLTPESRYMINADSISIMKKGVVIINTSRGHLIDSSALIDGLKSGIIGGAGLDVYEEESEYFFEDKSDELLIDDTLARLTTFNNVLITSHQGFFTEEAMSNIAATTLQNIDDFIYERRLVNGICVNCDGTKPCPGKPCKKRCSKR
jgi:D-lactate dehydrogenase